MDVLNTWILIIPGLNNSGPEHWQSLWQARYGPSHRVEQQNWDWPERDEWVTAMDHAFERTEAEPVLVAHSLGCITVAHWALDHRRPVKGAFLVAPVDLERPEFPPGVGGFAPTPMVKLPFPSIIVGSTNDEYCSIGRAEEFARAWGSRFVNAGACGHINVAAGFGEWPEGEELLKELL
jgi:predicted alpha/beta hydrolase family esterase